MKKMKRINLKKFYTDQDRLKYNPGSYFLMPRKGIKKFFSCDNRFATVANKLTEIIDHSSQLPVSLLDVGVGDAIYERLLSNETRAKVRVVGVDISDAQLKRSREYIEEGKRVDLDCEKLPYSSNLFDIVILSEVLEHLFYPDNALKEGFRVLKKGGFLFLTYPNSGSLHFRLALLVKGRSPLLNYPHNKEHIRFFNKADIFSMLNAEPGIKYFRGISSFYFNKWNFPIRIITPRFLEELGDLYLPNLALGHFMILEK